MDEEFNKHAEHFASKFSMDAKDIHEAYKDRPDSLKAFFNAEAKASSDTGWTIVFMSVSSLVFGHATPWLFALSLPVTLGYWLVRHHDSGKKSEAVRQAISKQIETFHAAKLPSTLPDPS
jgi:hypothetical protein